ncbi:MAG: 4'-phosphopantetheinyl transferase superfamily protein [Myxococcales bacterium]|nr:4'-phosphopantetheinyl transferase superfamily protein [Myxococcales bacterium]
MIREERETPFGWLVVASLQGEVDLGLLSPAERELTLPMGPRRIASFVGGRVALRRALDRVGAPATPLLATGRGGPTLPDGVTGSISHKDDVAVAVAARSVEGEHVGVDLETDAPLRVDIGRRVLREEEQARLAGLEPVARDRLVRETFAVKEAIYKAIDPVMKRYVAFQEVALELDGKGGALAILHLNEPAPAFSLEVAIESMRGPHGERMLLAFARARVTDRRRP